MQRAYERYKEFDSKPATSTGHFRHYHTRARQTSEVEELVEAAVKFEPLLLHSHVTINVLEDM